MGWLIFFVLLIGVLAYRADKEQKSKKIIQDLEAQRALNDSLSSAIDTSQDSVLIDGIPMYIRNDGIYSDISGNIVIFSSSTNITYHLRKYESVYLLHRMNNLPALYSNDGYKEYWIMGTFINGSSTTPLKTSGRFAIKNSILNNISE